VTRIIGHAATRTELAGLTANAVLLTGPARVGRRALARWWAQYLNCSQPLGPEPCGRCPSCLAFQGGEHEDYLLIRPRETTSTGRVSQRSLIPISAIHPERSRTSGSDEYPVKVLPFLETGPRHRHKVVVFDGAEFLNEQAANALLKVVEEPPHAARFIFIAEDRPGVLPTIASRSVWVRAAPVPDAEMRAALSTLEPLEPDEELLAFASGRPGLLVERERVRKALEEARAFLDGVNAGMGAALAAAERQNKAFDRSLTPKAIEFLLRSRAGRERLAAADAVERTVEALESYATPSLAWSALALDLRAAFGRAR
jgi:DNA polymerase-3 subunit delta'